MNFSIFLNLKYGNLALAMSTSDKKENVINDTCIESVLDVSYTT